jgi:TP901 family phage tail tape measure protein
MDAAMKIAIVLTAFDRMSEVVNKATGNAEQQMRKLMTTKFAEGAAMFESGRAVIDKFVSPAVEAYSKLEVANTDLQASMMDSTGAIDKNFKNISSLAEELGDKLPGTTADFYDLFKTMMQNGVTSKSILDGVGKSAAYLAVDLKMPYEAAGEFAARLKVATGVADSEMLGFMDTISRANSMGIGAAEMQYAFARSAGTLKMLGQQGLQASKDMTVLFAGLIRGGMSGETAAISFNNIIQNVLNPQKFNKFSSMAAGMGLRFQLFDKKGKFLGVENLVAQFDKMKDLSTTKKAELVQALTGGGADGQALNAIITNGAAGYRKMRSEMEAKAALNDKVNIKLKTLAALWEATTGTIENMLAALGAGIAPILKPIADMIGRIAGTLKEWFAENPRLAQFIMMVVTLVGVFLTLMGAIKIIQGIRVAMLLLNVTMAANPFILFASIAILAIGLIYANWGRITAFFSRLWESVKRIFWSVWNWIKSLFLVFTPWGLVLRHWNVITGFFSNLWQRVKNIFSGVVSWLGGLGSTFFNAGKNIIKSVYEGIKSMIMYPINKVKEMVGKIRNLLPFSPAKDGPLRDIHKIRLVETIADSIKPNSLLDKMRSVVKHTFDVMSGHGTRVAPVGGSRSGGNSVSINISLSGGATQQDAKKVVDELKKQFPQLMKSYQGQQSRVVLG